MSQKVECCGTARELTIEEYLKQLMTSENRTQEFIENICLRCIELHENETKWRDAQLQDAREERERAYMVNNAYRTVMNDIIRYGTRWD